MQFSANESVSLEKTVGEVAKKPFERQSDIDGYYEIERCVQWIATNGYKKVCLQFSDRLLPDASAVALRLQEKLGRTVYVLGDTSYESCCVDFVGTAHVDADAVVHFGPVCFSQIAETIPYLRIYEKWDCDLEVLKQRVFDLKNEELVILLDSEYVHLQEQIKSELKTCEVCHVHDFCGETKNRTVLYVGDNKKKLIHLKATLACDELFHYDPKDEKVEKFEMDSKILKRRYYLAEKIKDSTVVGIVIGTLAVKNYLRVIERMKKLLAAHKKKYYVISVGKLTVAKLANFSEIQVYVLISCSMNDVFENRDFYQTIVTPFDVEIALNNKALDTPFSYDYNHYINFSEPINVCVKDSSDVSLITGRIRKNEGEEAGKEVAVKPEGTVAVFLKERSWKGLEQNLGETEVKLAEEGRSGTAYSYAHETNL